MRSTEQEMVVIDGVGMPLWMYVAVKDRAVWTNETQFVGVRYHAALRFNELDSDFTRSTKIEIRLAGMATGQSVHFILNADRGQLNEEGDLAMILWITPMAGNEVRL